MATFEQIPFAGDQNTQNVFRLTILTQPCSDAPRITTWDDFNCNTTLKESLVGTVQSGNLSQVFGFDTTTAASSANWCLGLTEIPGGVWNAGNRLKGGQSFIKLGNPATPPGVNGTRTFNLAFGVAGDSTAGTAGHDCVLGITLFYTGVAPGILLQYNNAASETAVWKTLHTQSKGIATAPALPNAISATGTDSTTSHLDPVTKPTTGEKISEQYWVQTI